MFATAHTPQPSITIVFEQWVCCPLQAGKVRKHVSEQEKAEEGLGPNIKSIVTMLMLMLLMMFAVHCTWVTSNAYSSPSVVLASYNHDG